MKATLIIQSDTKINQTSDNLHKACREIQDKSEIRGKWEPS